jgi:hypothetical protein
MGGTMGGEPVGEVKFDAGDLAMGGGKDAKGAHFLK